VTSSLLNSARRPTESGNDFNRFSAMSRTLRFCSNTKPTGRSWRRLARRLSVSSSRNRPRASGKAASQLPSSLSCRSWTSSLTDAGSSVSPKRLRSSVVALDFCAASIRSSAISSGVFLRSSPRPPATGVLFLAAMSVILSPRLEQIQPGTCPPRTPLREASWTAAALRRFRPRAPAQAD